MKAIVITTDNTMVIKEFDRPLYKSVGKAVGGYIEHVRAALLPEPYCMIVNEEGLLIGLPMNLVGSLMYGTPRHGAPIVGNIVLMKDGYTEEGPDIVGLEDDEIEALVRKVSEISCGVVKLSEQEATHG